MLLTLAVPKNSTAQGTSGFNGSSAHWSHSLKKITEHTQLLTLKVILKPGWHIYSTRMKNGEPLPTRFTFDKSTAYAIQGSIRESSKSVSYFDPNLLQEVVWFNDSAIFTQKVKLLAPSAKITGHVDFMICNRNVCMPPDRYDFAVDVNAAP